MTLDAKSYLKAAFPPPLRRPGALPRIFTLHWDNHKVNSKRRDKDDWHEAYGTCYPTGTVTLDNGMFYKTMGELRAHYEEMGDCRVSFLLPDGTQEDEHV